MSYSALDASSSTLVASTLRFVNEVLMGQRFAGTDQNPHGIRDLLGSASLDAQHLALQITDRPRGLTHLFTPDKEYPWFCSACGYGPNETLKHRQVSS